jgi:hypothetical protein
MAKQQYEYLGSIIERLGALWWVAVSWDYESDGEWSGPFRTEWEAQKHAEKFA